jgi:cell division septal protein FtsQ
MYYDRIVSGDLIRSHVHILSMIGITLISLSTYIIVFSPYFRISPNQVVVESLTPGIDIAVAYRSLERVYGASIFLIDEGRIASDLRDNLSNLAAVSIDRYYPNGIKVLLTGAPILFDTTIMGIDKLW